MLNVFKSINLFVLKLLYVSKIEETEENPYLEQNSWLMSIWDGEVNGVISPLEKKFNFGILRFSLLIIILSGFLLPINFVRWAFHKKNLQIRYLAVEIYVVFKIVLLYLILYFGLFNYGFSTIISIAILVELFLSLFSRLFLADLFKPIHSYKRSLLLLLINFFEQIFAFAILYLHSNGVGAKIGDDFVSIHQWTQGVYFSFVTGYTIGYGDYLPFSNNARTIVCWQVISTFIFITLIIAHFTGGLSESKINREEANNKKTAEYDPKIDK